MAAAVIRSLREDGRVIRGYLGAAAQDLDERLARALDVAPSGALVADVVPEGPASIAGIRPKDVVTAIDGVPVTSARSFRAMVAPSQAHLTAGVEGWTLDADAREMLWVPNTFRTGFVIAKVRAGGPA
jgi:S1-C subfamily serine protease